MSKPPKPPLVTKLDAGEIAIIDRALAMSASHLDSRTNNAAGRNCSSHRELASKMRTLRARIGREQASLLRQQNAETPAETEAEGKAA